MGTETTTLVQEYRCVCGKLLFKGMLVSCNLEIKCKRCGAIKAFVGINDQSLSPWKYSLLLDRRGMIVDCSKSVLRELHYADSEVRNHYIYQFIPLLQPSLYQRLWNTQHSAIDVYSFEAVERKKSGDIASVTVHMRFIEVGGTTHVLCSVEGSDTLERTQEKNEKVSVECSSESHFVADITQDGRYSYTYGKVQNLCGITNLTEVPNFFGFTSAELLGKSISIFIPKVQRQQYIDKFNCLAEKHRAFRIMDIPATLKNEDTISFDAYFMPRHNDNGAFIGYSMTHWKKDF